MAEGRTCRIAESDGEGGRGVSGIGKGEESARVKDVVIEDYPAENSTEMRERCEERDAECHEEGREEHVEIGVTGRPVIFDSDDHRALAENVNPYLQPTPHDFLRFDCTEMGSPLSEILYETDWWAQQEPTGLRDWELPRETSEKEVGIGNPSCPRKKLVIAQPICTRV